MKNKIILGSMVAVLLSVTFVSGVYAANKFTLLVNGNKINADVRIIDGTTYLPLKDVAKAVGAQLSFNNQTKTITLNTPSPTNQTTNNTPSTNNTTVNTPVVKEIATRKNPAKIGDTVPFDTKGSLSSITGNLSVTEIIRGSEAWNMIHQANMFNSAPKDGHEYILAKIKIDITSNANSEAAVSISDYDFTLVSSGGTDYQKQSVVTPDPVLRTKIYVGGSQSGWAVFEVKQNDQEPLIVYGRKYDGSSGVWFKTVQ